MTGKEWDTIAILLDKGFKWREPFGEASEAAYKVLLDGCSAEDVATAIRSLVLKGQVFGPTPGELVALIRHDPDRPTFDECYQQLYGPGGVFGVKRSGVEISPWVRAFVERSGRERLKLLEVEHPDYGGAVRRELRNSYESFLEATEGREVAALASGRRGELGKLDPLDAVGGGRRELGVGS